MKFEIGEKVRLPLMNSDGWIRQMLDDHLYMVWIESMQMEMKLSSQHLSKYDAQVSWQQSVAGELWVCFAKAETDPHSYEVYLLNGRPSGQWFGIQLTFQKCLLLSQKGVIAAGEKLLIGQLQANDFTHPVSLLCAFGPYGNSISGATREAIINIRPKSFFEGISFDNKIGRPARSYPLFERAQFVAAESKHESIQDYHRRMTAEASRAEEPILGIQWSQRDLQAFAQFERTIDLHIEVLRADANQLSPSEIFRIQLNAFEDYIEEAIVLSVKQVAIIHGLGTGKLRDEIHRRLQHMRDVYSYTNEYHHLYGYGATIVTIR